MNLRVIFALGIVFFICAQIPASNADASKNAAANKQYKQHQLKNHAAHPGTKKRNNLNAKNKNHAGYTNAKTNSATKLKSGQKQKSDSNLKSVANLKSNTGVAATALKSATLKVDRPGNYNLRNAPSAKAALQNKNSALVSTKSSDDGEDDDGGETEYREADSGNNSVDKVLNTYYKVTAQIAGKVAPIATQFVMGIITTPLGPLAPFIQKTSIWTSIQDFISNIVEKVITTIIQLPGAIFERVFKQLN